MAQSCSSESFIGRYTFMLGHSPKTSRLANLLTIFSLLVLVRAGQPSQFNGTQDADDARTYYARATILYTQARYAEAIEAFQPAIRLKPDYALAYNGL